MAKFRYRMQSILNIKYQLETQAKMEVGRAQMQLNEEEERLRNFIDRKESYLEEGSQMRRQALNVNDLRDNRNAMRVMDDRIEEQKVQVRKAEEVLEKAREKLKEIMQERKMHEKLKEKALDQFLQEEKAAEGKVVDELTSYTYGQRGKRNGNGE